MSQKLIDRIENRVKSSSGFTPIEEIGPVAAALGKKAVSTIGGKLGAEAVGRSVERLKRLRDRRGETEEEFNEMVDRTIESMRSLPVTENAGLARIATPENAQAWAAEHEKYLFCVDLLGIHPQGPEAESLVNELESQFEEILSTNSGLGESHEVDIAIADAANMRDEPDEEFEDYQWDCPACNGNVESMGSLGGEEHGRCRDCGIGSSRTAMSESAPLEHSEGLVWRINRALRKGQ